MSYGGVIEVAVVGLPDEKWGDQIQAVIAVSDPDQFDIEQLKLHAKENLANYKRPKTISIWDELPKSAANKILRRKVKETLMLG